MAQGRRFARLEFSKINAIKKKKTLNELNFNAKKSKAMKCDLEVEAKEK